jgi:lactoylglutathione lyase
MQKATFDHIAIFVTNLQRSVDFYQNIIGLEPIPDPFNDDKHRWLKTGPGNAIHIIEGAKKEKEYFKSNHICFRVASLDVFINMLTVKGIAFEDADGTKNNKVNMRPDGVKQIWLQDPDGYWIEINNAKE